MTSKLGGVQRFCILERSGPVGWAEGVKQKLQALFPNANIHLTFRTMSDEIMLTLNDDELNLFKLCVDDFDQWHECYYYE